jgi:hypothetical protein
MHRYLMDNGRLHKDLAAAVTTGQRGLTQGHMCDLAHPVEALTAYGEWVCLGCVYWEAWGTGFGMGYRAGLPDDMSSSEG